MRKLSRLTTIGIASAFVAVSADAATLMLPISAQASTVRILINRDSYAGSIQMPTSTLTSEIQVFSEPDGERCRYAFDRGADNRNGEPQLGLDGNDVLEIVFDCEAGSILPAGFEVANPYYWLHELAVFARHPAAGYVEDFDWSDFSPRKMFVRVSTEADDFSPCEFQETRACTGLHAGRYTIVLPVATGAARDLAVLAHEHGHFVHHMYGFDPDGFAASALAEGFAEQNIARYSLFRHMRTEAFPYDKVAVRPSQDDSLRRLSYEASTDRVQFDHSNLVNVGQIEPARGSRPDSAIHSNSSALCDPEMMLPHECGEILAVIYWELAWNVCRTAYKTSKNGRYCEEGRSIIDGDADEAYRLVNDAFTYAITKTRNDSDLIRYFELVSERYDQLRRDGAITSAEFGRVMTVLNHHCLGWRNECAIERILPGANLPATRIKRAEFDDSCACEELIFAEDMTVDRGVDRRAYNDASALRFLGFDAPSDIAEFTITAPVDGYYQFYGSMRGRDGAETAAFFLERRGGGQSEVARTPGTNWETSQWIERRASDWAWSKGPRLALKRGRNTLRLRHMADSDIEAVRIKLDGAADSDRDGIPESSDNCPLIANVLQRDLDGDRLGDACDPDIDGDGVEFKDAPVYPIGPKKRDNCEFVSNPDQSDKDGDGVGDHCDADADGDGRPDPLKSCDAAGVAGSGICRTIDE